MIHVYKSNHAIGRGNKRCVGEMGTTNLKDIESTIRRSPSLMRELGGHALARHGWGDSDGGFGVTYPSDLDEWDRVVEKVEIPDGFVELYGLWGPPDGYRFVIRESSYLEHLVRVLVADDISCDVDALNRLRQTLPDSGEADSTVSPDCKS